jgi:hypothetical protein
MTKAVFTTKVTPSYKDLPERLYHFPRTYLNYVQQTVGDYIVYYEPRRSSAELSSRGGRQSYFAVARVDSVVEDQEAWQIIFLRSLTVLPIWTSTRQSRSMSMTNITRAPSRRMMAAPTRALSGEPCV